MKKILKKNFFLNKLNQYNLKKKMLILQIFCVILPLFLTDGAIITMLFREEKKANAQEMMDIAESVKSTVISVEESNASLMQDIYFNKDVNDFLEEDFESPLDFYMKRFQLMRDSSYKIAVQGSGRSIFTIYIDSPSAVNGGVFQKLDKIQGADWYQNYIDRDQEVVLNTDFSKITWETKRNVFMIRKMNYYNKDSNAILRVDIDYTSFLSRITSANYSSAVYICEGDRILLSNDGKGGVYSPYDILSKEQMERAGVKLSVNLYNASWDIYVMPGKNVVYETFVNNLAFLSILVLINFVFPVIMFNLMNKSFIDRLHQLDEVLKNVENDGLYQLPEISGSDEISMLMTTYNEMAGKLNELIQKEYINKLKQQESDLARQRAELQALHSQINPHFLFNALESIRMHSIIKKENETAQMVEKLALIQRQNVEWGDDLVKVEDEVRFVEAYLELQKYRFGNKLTYEISIDEDCQEYRIPKISLVTFVENACVHGMENKTSSCWIFVRASKNEKELILEIEDTGSGMSEIMRGNLEEAINQVDMEMLRENHRVGILNAALRLKMLFQDAVRFELDSESGAGTLVTIAISLSKLEIGA